MTAGELRRALLGVPQDALVVIQDDAGDWSPSYAERVPIGDGSGQSSRDRTSAPGRRMIWEAS